MKRSKHTSKMCKLRLLLTGLIVAATGQGFSGGGFDGGLGGVDGMEMASSTAVPPSAAYNHEINDSGWKYLQIGFLDMV